MNMSKMKFKIKKNKNKIILSLIVIVIIILICIIGFLVYNRLNGGNNTNLGNVDSEKLGGEIAIGDINMEVKTSTDEGRDLAKEAKALNSKYPDVVGYLKVPGTVIDTPVFQGLDNDRYLRYNRDNEDTRWGETFLDFRSDSTDLTSMSHIIIYGHNTETNSHFTPLLNYKDRNFFENHKYIEFSNLEKTYKFEVFSAYIADTDFYYIDTEFDTVDEYTEFLQNIKLRSIFDSNISVTKDDTILTLSTCDYGRDDGRFVVHAKLVQ